MCITDAYNNMNYSQYKTYGYDRLTDGYIM